MSDLVARMAGSVGELPAAEWDALTAGGADGGNPFMRHGFLSALEYSGSVGDGTG